MPLTLMAKKRRGRDIYQTLSGHTRDALAALCRHLRRRRPALERVLNEQDVLFPDFCQLMFLAVFLHDLGKATREFQERLRQETLDRDVSHTFFALPLVRTGLSARWDTLVQVLALSHHTQPFDRLYYSFYLLPRVRYLTEEIAAFLNTYADVYRHYGRGLFLSTARPLPAGLPEKGEREAIRAAVAALQRETGAWPETARTKAVYTLAITILKHCDGEASRAFSTARPAEGTVCGALLDTVAEPDDGRCACNGAQWTAPPAGPPVLRRREVCAGGAWSGAPPQRLPSFATAAAAGESRPAAGTVSPTTQRIRPGRRHQSAGLTQGETVRDRPAGAMPANGPDSLQADGPGTSGLPDGPGQIDAILDRALALMRAKQRERLVWICPGQTASPAVHARLAALCGAQNTGLVHALSYFPADPLAMGEPAGRQNGNGNGFAVKYGDRIFSRPVTVATVDHLVFALVHGFRQADYALGNLLTALVVVDGLPAPGTGAREYTLDALALLREMGVPCLAVLNETPRPVHPDRKAKPAKDLPGPPAGMHKDCAAAIDQGRTLETGTVHAPLEQTRLTGTEELLAGRQPATNLAAVFSRCTLFGYSPLEVRYGPAPLIELWPAAERMIDVIPAAQWRPELAGEPEEAARRQIKIPLTRYLDSPHEFTVVDGPAEKYVIWEKL
ncbi:CRISPR-associated endonuclease Cas3'' [Desulfotomaculum copahuensis]|uniref:CRISPR-associated endonuclease Cas3 n=1 Tax=Desulfotomaculum copahuensis TaxID=1838280 RepID=A0A1B7LKI3_9FIRM|nr:CRISPR-associated endonuclease Cas3'' [Desulfotomaculum copahuensis]OAT87050.1 CRISPR-associated endonuclease Cas3'' [Desulfotomaculum copahuensis]